MPGVLHGCRSVPAPLLKPTPPPLHELLRFAEQRPTLNPPLWRIRAAFPNWHCTELQYHAELLRHLDDPVAWAMAPGLMERLYQRRERVRARRMVTDRLLTEGLRA